MIYTRFSNYYFLNIFEIFILLFFQSLFLFVPVRAYIAGSFNTIYVNIRPKDSSGEVPRPRNRNIQDVIKPIPWWRSSIPRPSGELQQS